ncbi:MAG: sporulation protein YabP [Oscillospiraceae bacterium]|nr:sporulation protein YabP [Oscillospiraceae bacterium]
MNVQGTNESHSVLIKGREVVAVSGVTRVLSFDETAVLLETIMGTMAVDGDELCITRLDPDRKEVDINGKVSGIAYAAPRKRRKKRGE